MTTTKEVTYEDLLAFIDERLGKGSTIVDWNNAREEAKQWFPQQLISRLDASGKAVSYNLLPKPE